MSSGLWASSGNICPCEVTKLHILTICTTNGEVNSGIAAHSCGRTERLEFGNVVRKKKMEKNVLFVASCWARQDFCRWELKPNHYLNVTKQSPPPDYAGWSMIHIRLRLAQIMLVHSNGNVPPNSTSQDTDATLQNIHIGDGSGLKMLPSCPDKSTFKSARLEKLSAIQSCLLHVWWFEIYMQECLHPIPLITKTTFWHFFFLTTKVGFRLHIYTHRMCQ